MLLHKLYRSLGFFWVLVADFFFFHGFSVASCALKVVNFDIFINIRLFQTQISECYNLVYIMLMVFGY